MIRNMKPTSDGNEEDYYLLLKMTIKSLSVVWTFKWNRHKTVKQFFNGTSVWEAYAGGLESLSPVLEKISISKADWPLLKTTEMIWGCDNSIFSAGICCAAVSNSHPLTWGWFELSFSFSVAFSLLREQNRWAVYKNIYNNANLK